MVLIELYKRWSVLYWSQLFLILLHTITKIQVYYGVSGCCIWVGVIPKKFLKHREK